jgi:hypothetical protein
MCDLLVPQEGRRGNRQQSAGKGQRGNGFPERQRGREAERQRGREAERQRGREAERQRGKRQEAERQRGKRQEARRAIHVANPQRETRASSLPQSQ